MAQNSVSDRLYELLPVVHRRRDAEHGYPLKALLSVISEQVGVIEDDIERLYDNWFIETCEDWAVPYIGDLIEYRRVEEAGLPGDVESLHNRVRNRAIIPRREVAKTVRLRRRKGTLALLEELAWDVADWPGRAVEFCRLVSQTQAINHLRPDRGCTIDVRDPAQFDLIYGRRLEPESDQKLEPAEVQHERLISHGAFDTLSHAIDVRRINSRSTPARYNLPDVGLFVFRLKAYPICKSRAPAHRFGSERFTFSALGNDMPLFIKPFRESDPTWIAEEINLPVPLRRRALDRDLGELREARKKTLPCESLFYGKGKSFAIWTVGWEGHVEESEPVPAEQISSVDISDWEHKLPRKNEVFVDPVLGRIVFPPKQFPDEVYVSYHYAFSNDIGGGQYDRELSAPDGAFIYQVGEELRLKTIEAAYEAWQQDLTAYQPTPKDAVIEIVDNREYREEIHFELGQRQSLQLRAVNGRRPVIKLSDWAVVEGQAGSRFVLDGILLAGWPLRVRGELSDLIIRHSTLLPGSSLAQDCKPDRPGDPSLELLKTSAAVNIEHSILGSIRVKHDEVGAEPSVIRLADSILDATSPNEEALGSNAELLAHAVLTMARSTVIGYVETHAFDLAENCVFLGRVTVGRRQRGCMRFCYVDPTLYNRDGRCSRTPKRYRCQPDSALRTLPEQDGWDALPGDRKDELQRMERLRVQPTFNALRYGMPTYCQLAESCAQEIKRGADDQSEMGAFHDLYEPQRRALLDVRLNEYTPADTEAGLIYVT